MRKTCLNNVFALAKRDERVVFIGSDLGIGVLDDMCQEIPERFFMEGVAEQNVIGMAAGLAMEGFVPYVNTIATFLTRRCFEQVAVDLCLQNLSVRLIANGGGMVYAPLGPTHLAFEDIAIMTALPNMTVVAPTDADEMSRFMEKSLDWPGPIYIRLGKGGDPIVSKDSDGFEIGKAIVLREPGEIAIIACGVTVARALKAAEILADKGIECGVINMHTLKPLDHKMVLYAADHVRTLVTLEEHTLQGGLGSMVCSLLMDSGEGPHPKVIRMGIPDEFPAGYGSQDTMMESFGLQPTQIAEKIQKSMQRTKQRTTMPKVTFSQGSFDG
jgi:transketolase